MARVVAFGELLLRLSAPGRELLMQSARFDVVVGGAEANVAVALARFGHDARVVSVVPDSALGEAATGELRRWGVETGGVRTGPGRMGLYFLQPGAIHRPPDILYDRAGSAFALAPAELIDWDVELAGADWLHVSGVTAALGPANAEAAIRAVKAARAAGVRVSVDCNYRAKLWEAWDGDAPAILSAMLDEADLMFGDHRDLALLGVEDAFARFPNLRMIAATSREELTVDHHRLSAKITARDVTITTEPRELPGIVDRIGAGDAFAAGVIYAVLNGWDAARTAEWGLAAACLKHAQPGDALLARPAEVEALIAGAGYAVRR